MARPIKPAPDQWWWPRLTPGFVVLCVVLSAALVWLILSRLPVGVLPIMLALWVPVFVNRRQRRWLANRVLTREGVTCPCCLRVLPEDAPHCLQCDTGLGRSVYVDYCTQASTQPGKSESWWRAQNEAKGQRGRTTHLTMQWLWQLGLLLGCFAVGFVGLVVWRPSLLLTMQWLWVLPIIVTTLVGIGVMARYGRRRLGDSLHCGRCDYQIDPDRLSMPTCPECGGGLTQRDQTVVGRRVGHGGYTLLGILLMAVPILLPMVPLFTGGFGKLSPSNYLPVSIYIDDALSDDPDYKTWRVLESRYAKTEDVQRLVDAVLAQLAGEVEPGDNLRSFRMDGALAFQLDGPGVPEDLRLEVALALMQDRDGSLLFELRDWQARYLTTLLPGSNAYRVLISAAESAFASGQADYRVTRWLGNQRGEPLALYNEFGHFCMSLLTLDTVTNADGQALVIRTNPNVTLSPGLHPDEPVALYLRIVEPGSSTGEVAPSDLRFDPFEHLGRSHTLATIPIDDGALNTDDYRVLYVVYVGDTVLPASIVQWYDDWPMLPGNGAPDRPFGPMELAPGRMIARDLSLHPRSRGPPPLPSRPR